MGGRGDYPSKQNDQVRETKASGTRSDRSQTREFTGRQVSGGLNPGEESLRNSARKVLGNTGREATTYPSSLGGDEQSYGETRNDAAQSGFTSAKSMGSIKEWVEESKDYAWDNESKRYQPLPDTKPPYSDYLEEARDYNPHPVPKPASYVDYLYEHGSNSPTSGGPEGNEQSYGLGSNRATIDSDDADDTNVRLERPRSNRNKVDPLGPNDRLSRFEKPRNSERYS